MKFLDYKLSAILLASQCLISTPAEAQFVKGNDAVKVTTAGKKVETPPVPASMGKVCGADANCHAGAWHMVETDRGLLECTEPFARPKACRGSSYGAQKLPRLWIVKVDKAWLWCQYPDLGSKCVNMFSRPPANLPHDAVQ
jgi:hypothetical protein